MRLRTRIALAVGGAAAFSFLVALAVSIVIGHQVTYEILMMHKASDPQLLAATASLAVRQGEPRMLQDVLQIIRTRPGVDYAYVSDPSGRIFMHTQPEFTGHPVVEWKQTPLARASNELQAPFGLPDGKMGMAVIGVPSILHIGLMMMLGRFLGPFFLVAAVIGIALVLVLSLQLSGGLARPLQALADASRELGQGNLAAQVEPSAPGEIGELAERFNEMAKQLQVFDRLKDQFVSNVSHELRSPLAAIAMNADYLLEQDPERTKLGPKQREMLTAIQDCAVRLAVQVNTVLDAAKLRAGKMEYKLTPVAVDAAAARAVALFSVAAGSVGVSLASEIASGLPKVLADQERLDAILSNLIWNGLKYTPSGGRVMLQAKASDGMVELTVADTGKGIAKEEQERLFSPFERADEADQERRRVRGTGLGLFIVKLTVEGMGGRVRMESEPGRGTRVTFALPTEKRA